MEGGHEVKKLLMLMVLCVVAVPAFAQDEVSLFDPVRGQLAVGANYEWFNATGEATEPDLFYQKEFTLGVYGSWNLVPSLDLIGFTKYGLDNRIFNTAVGIRYVLFSGKE